MHPSSKDWTPAEIQMTDDPLFDPLGQKIETCAKTRRLVLLFRKHHGQKRLAKFLSYARYTATVGMHAKQYSV